VLRLRNYFFRIQILGSGITDPAGSESFKNPDPRGQFITDPVSSESSSYLDVFVVIEKKCVAKFVVNLLLL
jgi:hypothetical protein